MCKIRSPVEICCMIQGTQTQCLVTTKRGGMEWEVRGSFKREVTYVYLWLIHVDVWQKQTQYCKGIILQLKINFKKRNLDFLCLCRTLIFFFVAEPNPNCAKWNVVSWIGSWNKKKEVSGKTGEIWVNPGVYLIKLKCLLNFDKCTKVMY